MSPKKKDDRATANMHAALLEGARKREADQSNLKVDVFRRHPRPWVVNQTTAGYLSISDASGQPVRIAGDTFNVVVEAVNASDSEFVRVPRILLCDAVVLLASAMPKDGAARFTYEHLIGLLNKVLGY